MVEHVEIDGILHAIIIRNEYSRPGIQFFTPENFSQQLAHMSHPKGKRIEPHIHNVVERSVALTQEVLVIKKGILRVDFYHANHKFAESRELKSGDVILLATGGHGFEILEDAEIAEIKQGPYLGDNDKVRFEVSE